METLACPPKFKHMGDFHKYYNKEIPVPVLTIFIGGNHEASVFLRDLYYGGWVAPNIYYLGSSGSVLIRKGTYFTRISGVSGIEKPYDYRRGYFEHHPF